MSIATIPEDRDIIGSVLDILKEQGDDSQDLQFLARQLYATIDEGNVPDYSEAELAAFAVLAFEMMAEKPHDKHSIRVYCPAFGEDAKSIVDNVTVIEIVNDDMPFLLDSILAAIQEMELRIHFVVHPVATVLRDGKGRFKAFVEDGEKDQTQDSGKKGKKATGAKQGAKDESFIQIHFDQRLDEEASENLIAEISKVLKAVRTAVTDWPTMVERLNEAISLYRTSPPPVYVADLAESILFLKWLAQKNFTFLGMREYQLVGEGETSNLEPVEGTGLGILKDQGVHVLRRGKEMVHLTPEVRKFFFAPAALIVKKANVRSVVHRRIHMEYIGLKLYDADGDLSGELRIVGLFTSAAYNQPTIEIPFLRHKMSYVLERSGYQPNSHPHKALTNILETFPRDELFQVDLEYLYQTAMGIFNLELIPRPRVFVRIDEFDRFVSLLIYVPRNRFSTGVRKKMSTFFAKTYKGRVSAYYLYFPEGGFVRLHLIIGRYEGKTPNPDPLLLEQEVCQITTTWPDALQAQLSKLFSQEQSDVLAKKYMEAFPVGYREVISPEQAIHTIQYIELLDEDTSLAVNFHLGDYVDNDRRKHPRVHVKLYHLGGPISLSERVPILENMGFSVIDERSYRIEPCVDGVLESVCLHDMIVEYGEEGEFDIDEYKDPLEECFLKVWDGVAANDTYNKLVISAKMDWREAALMRALGAYMRQMNMPFSQSYLCETLVRHTGVTEDLVKFFHMRFNPTQDFDEAQRREKQRELVVKIEDQLASIPSLDEDRILRQFTSLMQASSRTNFFQSSTGKKDTATIAFKFKSRRIENLPEPKPFAEIFVYSPRVEGIHLRGGRIARGGLRWSDRPQDFRTEILSLAKAQQVKNTVIIPTGAKGGFVPQQMPLHANREEILKEGIACYQLFISTLLSITDNLVDGEVVPPSEVIRYDDDDPYLVVAADKGTAAFSDIANEISCEKGFWLGDAFASGGSVGYDHKKMGITARGGWEAVKRHFREIDIDVQTEPITVIGIGDMSGDVFGNGMLLSQELKLIAAFDHRDIFIDPQPDPKSSWEERKRLFDLGRSSWQDYDVSLISKGGGIFSRQLKSIDMSPEMCRMTGFNQDKVTPNQLMRALLRSEADLLWFGGIGTYIRASHESDDEAGDRTNDSLRITARQLNVKVIGEGANLGLTHPARIEFANLGGRLNTDAIDNSAGVNSSDLEVNIKITLGAALSNKKFKMKGRNKLLAEMTDEVATVCLNNNYLQTLAISLDERRGLSEMSFQKRLMQDLEASVFLNREIEFLPNDAELTEREQYNQPFTRPELAVLLAYAKIDLTNTLGSSPIPDDPYLAKELFAYFPDTLGERLREEIEGHRLKGEIVSTMIANEIINRGGATITTRLKEETGRSTVDIAYAFIVASAVFNIVDIYRQIDELDNKISGQLQLELYAAVQDLLIKQTAWFLRNGRLKDDLVEVIDLYRSGIEGLSETLLDILPGAQLGQINKRQDFYEAGGVPRKLAIELASLVTLAKGSEIVSIAETLGYPIDDVSDVFWNVGAYFSLGQLGEMADKMDISDHFDRLAINSVIATVSTIQGSLTQTILNECQGKAGENCFAMWCARRDISVQRSKRRLEEILESGELTISKLTVAVSQLGELVMD